MWGRFVIAGLFLISAAIGYPYAGLIINRMLGTNTVVFNEHDGTQRTLIMGPSAPRPGWLPVLPRSLVVTAGHWLPSPGREVAGDLELLTHASLETINRFYLRELRAAGFDVRDIGHGPMNAATAAYLGIDGTLEGNGGPDDLHITVRTRSAGGLVLSSRIVQIHWQRPVPPPLGKAAQLAR